MYTTTITKSGQITLTKAAREQLGVKPGDKVYVDFATNELKVKRVPTNDEFLAELDAIGGKDEPATPKIPAEDAVRAFRDGKVENVLTDYRRKYEVA